MLSVPLFRCRRSGLISNIMKNLDYGVIGNCRTAALVSAQGSIDWLCFPDFDSPSIFARLLDEDRGGSFGIECTGNHDISQSYLPGTNILRTCFTSAHGDFIVYDYMPRYKLDDGRHHHPAELVRYIIRVSGKPRIRIRYKPSLVYARYETVTKRIDQYIKSTNRQGQYESIYLYSSFVLEDILESGEIELTGNAFLLLSYNQKINPPDLNTLELDYERTKEYWIGWIAQNTFFPFYNEEIQRSALVLKLLTFQRSGAIIAAVTTSLPERIGSVRNWDYRFCWIRDASMTIRVLNQIGHDTEAKRFLNFILRVIPYKREKIQIMYGIHGQKTLKEKELPWLSGYEGSKPVRVGNAAYRQKQNDIYGVLLDVIHQNIVNFETAEYSIEEMWTVVRTLVRHIKNNWKSPDRGLWEIRNTNQHFVFSKVLSWVGMDRAIKIAEILGQGGYVREWEKLRKRIRKDIEENGWNEKLGAYTQYYGSSFLDASNLLMEYYHFLDPKDPRYESTVRLTYKELNRDGLMYRYKNADDFGLPSSSFTVCTFWMIRGFYKIGECEKAVELFENLLTKGNHLGLFSEDIDFVSKRLLGNFPQAYSHLALIDTAMTLNQGRDVNHPLT